MNFLNAILEKQVTAWRFHHNDFQIDFDDGGTLAICGTEEDDDLDLEVSYFEEADEDEETDEEPTAADRYTGLAQSVRNMYTHKVTIDRATGALVCEGCDRENAELGQEACDV